MHGKTATKVKKAATKIKKAAPKSSVTTSTERGLKPHEALLSTTISSAATIAVWGKFAGEIDFVELIGELRDRVKKVQDGDLQPVEAMLLGQAMALETIFTHLAGKAIGQEYLKQFHVNLTLALKAQAQCRATLEALAEIKNPRPLAFVKQANIANGPQQVNNAVPEKSEQHARAGENAFEQNELLEDQHGIELDTGAQSTSVGADTRPEAVGTVHGATHP